MLAAKAVKVELMEDMVWLMNGRLQVALQYRTSRASAFQSSASC